MINKIREDIKIAMKNKEKDKLSTLRMLLSTIENRRIELKLEKVEDMSDDEFLTCINRNIKALKQQMESLEKANRDTNKQLAEQEVLESYLPKQLTDEEIVAEIEYALNLVSSGEIDNPMKYLSNKLKGKADMGKVSKIVRKYK